MPVTVIKGNIFTSGCQTTVNTVNCVGVMGAGIALEYRLRYPEMYERYAQLCEAGKIDIGKLWIYKADRWILNFPTKKHWKYPTKLEFLEAGLAKFVDTYEERGIESIAFPLLGADKGGIPPEESLALMHSYLDGLAIRVEIYKYDPGAQDDLYVATKKWLLGRDISDISRITGIRAQYVTKVLEAIGNTEIVQLNQLARVKGIGLKTMESIFRASRLADQDPEVEGEQGSLPI